MVDQCISRGLLDFNVDFVKKLCNDTRINKDKSWTRNKDPFYSPFFPAILWNVLGSRLRAPGRESIPAELNGVKPGSKTNEVVHFSVRQKMEDIALPGAKSPLPSPSRAIDGYQYDAKLKAWVWVKDKDSKNAEVLNEFNLPSDPNSLEAWICSDWLKYHHTN
jgi:hypothetical protein